ncbi:hypothetical protein LTR95_010260 [Oleoguttula sp. CCFEE 5521]
MFVKKVYADVERGLFLVRGENVTLLGEIDSDKDDYVSEIYKLAPVGEVFALEKAQDAKARKADLSKQRKLAAIGFENEHHDEAILRDALRWPPGRDSLRCGFGPAVLFTGAHGTR